MFVVAVGNAFDGIKIVGPFDSVDIASKWAISHIQNEFNIILLYTKEEHESLGE